MRQDQLNAKPVHVGSVRRKRRPGLLPDAVKRHPVLQKYHRVRLAAQQRLHVALKPRRIVHGCDRAACVLAGIGIRHHAHKAGFAEFSGVLVRKPQQLAEGAVGKALPRRRAGKRSAEQPQVVMGKDLFFAVYEHRDLRHVLVLGRGAYLGQRLADQIALIRAELLVGKLRKIQILNVRHHIHAGGKAFGGKDLLIDQRGNRPRIQLPLFLLHLLQGQVGLAHHSCRVKQETEGYYNKVAGKHLSPQRGKRAAGQLLSHKSPPSVCGSTKPRRTRNLFYHCTVLRFSCQFPQRRAVRHVNKCP